MTLSAKILKERKGNDWFMMKKFLKYQVSGWKELTK